MLIYFAFNLSLDLHQLVAHLLVTLQSELFHVDLIYQGLD